METIKAYVNYGVLGAEKIKVYTVSNPHGHARASEEIKLIVPGNMELSYNWMEEPLITTPDGTTYLAEDMICGDTEPCFRWFCLDKRKMEQVKLAIAKEGEFYGKGN